MVNSTYHAIRNARQLAVRKKDVSHRMRRHARCFHATERGSLMIAELLVAVGILAASLIPLSFMVSTDHARLLASYRRAVAMEIVDGEIEILTAGEWKTYNEGSQPYTVRAQSARNLPPGRFELTIRDKHMRLEWLPDKPSLSGKIAREVILR